MSSLGHLLQQTGRNWALETRRRAVFRHHRPPLEVSQGGMQEGEARARQRRWEGEERRKAWQA